MRPDLPADVKEETAAERHTRFRPHRNSRLPSCRPFAKLFIIAASANYCLETCPETIRMIRCREASLHHIARIGSSIGIWHGYRILKQGIDL